MENQSANFLTTPKRLGDGKLKVCVGGGAALLGRIAKRLKEEAAM